MAVLLIGIIIGIFLPDMYSYTTNAFAEPIAPPETLVPTTNNTNITCVPLDTESNIYRIIVSSTAMFKNTYHTMLFVRWGPGDIEKCHDENRICCLGGTSYNFDIPVDFTGLSGEIPIILSQVPFFDMPYNNTTQEYPIKLGNETVIKEIRYRIPSQP